MVHGSRETFVKATPFFNTPPEIFLAAGTNIGQLKEYHRRKR
jgi:hypothetical protein